jgi:hypothetical protein
LSDEDVDKIILAGGSSLSPIVQDAISNEFSIEMELSINPAIVVSKGAAIYAGNIEKPPGNVELRPFSLILSRHNDEIIGKAFSLDSKFSFLGFDVEFGDGDELIRIPLSIDGEFKANLPDGPLDISICKGDAKMDLDERSPNSIDGDSITIPYLDDSFKTDDCEIALKEILDKYAWLTEDIEYLNDYSHEMDVQIIGYIERLLEISDRNPIAFNQTWIYLNHLEKIVDESRRDLEFSILEGNVLGKIEVIESNNLFEIDDVGEILKSRDLDRLKEYYGNLVEEYVKLNRNEVIEEIFYSLRLDGIYTNERLADELAEKADIALDNGDYNELFRIVNLLYELDERLVK